MKIPKTIPAFLAMTAMVGTLSIGTMQPAKADGAASTRNILIGAAAIAGLAIEANVANKNAIANTIVGSTADGSTVYENGLVVLPDGQSFYPGNDGETVACNDGACTIEPANVTTVVYAPIVARPIAIRPIFRTPLPPVILRDRRGVGR